MVDHQHIEPAENAQRRADQGTAICRRAQVLLQRHAPLGTAALGSQRPQPVHAPGDKLKATRGTPPR